ncbi:VOC family protein [Actinomadura hibisca]|uniref:VOC family protein n=1 Tax=Actinomadura hibisca TaxID=68565 RepID=UPI00082C8D26|nr:VOC family protein [Actinomadura hibisca]
MDWKIELICVPVTDLDRAKEFYGERLGFTVDLDSQGKGGEGFRIIQFTPPGSACSISVGTGITTAEPGSLQGLQVVVADIEAARKQLLERGVEASNVQHFENGEMVDGPGERWNSFVYFSDPDGNGWVLQERPADA